MNTKLKMGNRKIQPLFHGHNNNNSSSNNNIFINIKKQ